MTDPARKLRTIIVDDEPLARKLLRALLSEIPEVELVAECKNGHEAVQATLRLTPDLLILDIQMPGVSGFDVIKELQADVVPMVIFCTAYQRYALDAFDLYAVDYLLKPVDEKRLQLAIARTRERFNDVEDSTEHKSPLMGAIDEIAKKAAARSSTKQPDQSSEEPLAGDRKIVIKDNEGTVLVSIDDIDWVDAAGDYMCVHVKGETLILRSTLKNLVSKLDPEMFVRIHRSTVVNLKRIVKATPLNKGEYILDLDCDEQLKVSRNYRQAIKDFLTEL
ncbi:MAG: two-component system LytT family response regulator [Bacteroidia bacterium]|jgi:two-component system LytT family response regulator